MHWFQIKEQAAGTKRLILTWYLYKLFGKKILDIIAFLVSFYTFIFVPSIRNYSKQYLSVVYDVTNIKPNLYNQFRHIHIFADSLVDKMLVYSGNFMPNNIVFENESDREQLFKDINENKGVFFICNHIGNIEVLHSLFYKNIVSPNFKTNIFLSNKQSQIFNSFLNNIKVEYPIKTFLVDDIGLETSIELKDNLNNGEVVFIAGDRLSENNTKSIQEKIFGHNILLPIGVYKFAKLMEVPVYFASAIKFKDKYTIYLQKQHIIDEQELAHNFALFLEKMIKISPLEFYHFYDFFNYK